MAINFTTFFTDAGKAFFSGNTTNTAVETTINDEVEDYVQEVTGSLEIHEAVSNVPGAMPVFKSSAATLNDTVIRQSVRNLLVQMIDADKPQPSLSASDAITQLVKQMEDNSETVDKSVPGGSVAFDAGNNGDGVIVVETKRGDGKENEHILAEAIEGTITATATDGTATWELKGESLAASKMAVDWPKGSAVNSSITSDPGAGTNLVNGTFETEDDESADLPAGWIVGTGVLGTTIKMTPVEVQTVVISGDPSGGFYVLKFTDRNSVTQTTVPLTFNATSSAVQSALNDLVGLASVTIVETGATPNLTHTLTLTDVSNPGELTNGGVGDLTGGTPVITHATTTAGSANVLRGARALEYDSSGAETTALLHPVSGLVADQQLALNLWMLADVAPAAGVITVELLDGIGGSVINDSEGTANSFTIDCTVLTTSYVAKNATFRIPTTIPSVVYLQVRISTAVTAGSSIFIDDLVLKEMDLLYTGGPSVAAFSGITDWSLDDLSTITTTNDRGGNMNEWMNRVFDLDAKNLLLPSATAPGTQPDTLIS